MAIVNRNKPVKVPIGMIRSWFAQIASEPANALPTYGTVQDMGAARLGTITKTAAEVDIEGDDIVLTHLDMFTAAQLVAETTLSDLELNSLVYGHAYAESVEHSGANDSSPYGGYAFIEPVLKKDKTLIYRATFLPKLSATAANEAQSAATRQGGSITPTYNSVTYTVYACNSGDWRLRQDFDTEAAAEAWLMGIFGSTTSYEVSITVVGSGTVSPSGTTYVEAGEDISFTFGSTPEALFDNGTDVTASISTDTYTISNVAAAHELVAVFAST